MDEMYVGYLAVPAGLRRFLKYASAVAVGLVVGISYVVATTQPSPGRGSWQDAASRTFTGVVSCDPYPVLHAADRGDGTSGPVFLVESGKHGSLARASEFAGRHVAVSGTVLHRDGRWMVELDEGESAISVREGPAEVSVPVVEEAGRVTLRGEIVDSKCYLGAMKPGEGKSHKECAILCISGGIPPLLVTWNAAGEREYYVLLNPSGGPLEREAWPFVADLVEVSGELECQGNVKRVRVSVKDIRRL